MIYVLLDFQTCSFSTSCIQIFPVDSCALDSASLKRFRLPGMTGSHAPAVLGGESIVADSENIRFVDMTAIKNGFKEV